MSEGTREGRNNGECRGETEGIRCYGIGGDI
jgi:hypothetical protein